MWWLLKMLFVGPPAKAVEAPLRRRLNDVESDVEQLQSRADSQKGKTLTLERRVGRLEREIWDEEFDDDEQDGGDFQKLLDEKRRARG